MPACASLAPSPAASELLLVAGLRLGTAHFGPVKSFPRIAGGGVWGESQGQVPSPPPGGASDLEGPPMPLWELLQRGTSPLLSKGAETGRPLSQQMTPAPGAPERGKWASPISPKPFRCSAPASQAEVLGIPSARLQRPPSSPTWSRRRVFHCALDICPEVRWHVVPRTQHSPCNPPSRGPLCTEWHL